MLQTLNAAAPVADPIAHVRTLEPSGERIGYFECGHGPLLVMLHACGTGAHTLRPLAMALAVGRRVICPDLDGYGATALAGTSGNAIDRHQRVLATILEHCDTDAYDLFGHSMGGFIALKAAAAGIARPRRLIVTEPTAFGLLDDAVPAQAAAKALDRAATATLVAAVEAGEPERGMAAFMGLWNETPWDALPAQLRARLTALAPQVAREARLVCDDPTPATAYAAIACPLLLLQGEQAPAPIQALMPVLAQHRPDARRITVPGVGHMGPLTSPQRFATLIETFLDEAAA